MEGWSIHSLAFMARLVLMPPVAIKWNQVEPSTEPSQMLPKKNKQQQTINNKQQLHKQQTTTNNKLFGTKWNQARNQAKSYAKLIWPPLVTKWNQVEPSTEPSQMLSKTDMATAWNQVEPSGTKHGTKPKAIQN